MRVHGRVQHAADPSRAGGAHPGQSQHRWLRRQENPESVRIKTNDPNRPWIEVAVTGIVEKFAEIRPERVRLFGRGMPLAVEVEIFPRKDFPFTIGQIKAKSGKFIRFELTERCTDGKMMCHPGGEYADGKGPLCRCPLHETDSEIRPDHSRLHHRVHQITVGQKP